MSDRAIMIVEDDESIREMLKLTLELEGYSVVTARNGQDALDRLARPGSVLPGLIFLDLMMPVMDGWEFAARARKDSRLSSVPIVLVTAFAERCASVTQAVGVIRKPVDAEELYEFASRYCGEDRHGRDIPA